MGYRNARGIRLNKRKSQASFEFIILLSAYLAFVAVLASAAGTTLEKSRSYSALQPSQTALTETCLLARFFARDGGRTALLKDFSGFSAQGSVLHYENRSLDCGIALKFDRGLKVETPQFEYR